MANFARLRVAGISTLMLVSACQLNSVPMYESSSKGKGGKASDAGSDKAQAERGLTVETTRVRSAHDSGLFEEDRQDAAAPDGDRTDGSAGRDDDDDSTQAPAADKGSSDESMDKDADQPADQSDVSIADGGVQDGALDGGGPDAGDGGARPEVEDPIGVLTGLAGRTPQAKTAVTINRFLEALRDGDAPASSIREFLETIDEEIDCQQNPFATECLAACQAVSTTCVVCVLDDECRASLLDICGVSALAGCTMRR